MDRRAFLAASALASFEGFSPNSAAISQVFADGSRQPARECTAAGAGPIRLHPQTRRHR